MKFFATPYRKYSVSFALLFKSFCIHILDRLLRLFQAALDFQYYPCSIKLKTGKDVLHAKQASM